MPLVLLKHSRNEHFIMHTSLAPHLHTDECNKLIEALHKCHQDYSKFRQLFGVCNDIDTQMRRCTKNERLARTRIHLDESKRKREEIQEKMSQFQKSGRK